jgi:MYXO-CTERM domain-containing protein
MLWQDWPVVLLALGALAAAAFVARRNLSR